MSHIEEILKYNKKFVEDKQYELYKSTKYPTKKIAVLSCMDTRLTELLPAALNFKNGDIKIIKNAGAIITHPFGSVMRSLLIAKPLQSSRIIHLYQRIYKFTDLLLIRKPEN